MGDWARDYGKYNYFFLHSKLGLLMSESFKLPIQNGKFFKYSLAIFGKIRVGESTRDYMRRALVLLSKSDRECFIRGLVWSDDVMSNNGGVLKMHFLKYNFRNRKVLCLNCLLEWFL